MHTFDPDRILAILDECCAAYTFPMLDNGYVYLAATRLSLYRSVTNWAMVIEIFGFSPRSMLPDTSIQTFAATLHERNRPERYVNREGYKNYLANNPHNEWRTVWPIEEGAWQNEESHEYLNEGPTVFSLRGRAMKTPDAASYKACGITLAEPPRVRVAEFCRWLAATEREAVLATSDERRVSVEPSMAQLLQLEEWHHPGLVNDEITSRSPTFQQLARVLSTGDVSLYRPAEAPNTHWRNWPDGGSL
jgi:hypothetical protein